MSGLRIWLMAARPRTLPAAIAPVPATKRPPVSSPGESLSTTASANIRPAEGPPMSPRLIRMSPARGSTVGRTPSKRMIRLEETSSSETRGLATFASSAIGRDITIATGTASARSVRWPSVSQIVVNSLSSPRRRMYQRRSPPSPRSIASTGIQPSAMAASHSSMRRPRIASPASSCTSVIAATLR